MLPLLSDSTPANASSLADALTRGLLERGVKSRRIEVEGAAFPAIDTMRIDVSGAQLKREMPFPSAAESGGDIVQIAAFELIGSPLFLESAPVEVRVAGQDVQARLQMTDRAGSLVLQGAAAGTASVEIAHAALEELVHAFAVEAAAKQGLEVKKTNLTFVQVGPRVVTFRAEVVVKVFIMSATLALTGRLSVDDEMNARLSDLALDGDAMILKLAGGFARPHLDRLEGRVFPLMAFTAGGLRLRNLELTVGTSLRAHADFGAAGQAVI